MKARKIAALVFALVSAFPLGSAAEKPNIVVILADDMGYSDLGCYGSEIATPNIDSLAARGVRFTQFHNNGRCCPTRASLLTGLYSHQAGIGLMDADQNQPGYRGFLNDRCKTIAEVLKAADYQTMMVGKWHVGTERGHWPTDRGFDRVYGSPTSPGHYFRLDQGRILLEDAKPILPPENWYATDAFTDYACRFLEDAAKDEKPFFLYLPYTAPHWPLHALPEDIALYRGKYLAGWDALRRQRYERMIALGISDNRWPLSPRDSEAPAWEKAENKDELDLRMAVYAAQIHRLDLGVGRVLETLRKINAEKNTIIVFLSDNGSSPEESDKSKPGAVTGTAQSYRSAGRAWANLSNTPFRRHKRWVHEGGIATPLIVSWPGVTEKPGSINATQVGHVIDLMPTLLDAAGVSFPKEENLLALEGISLRSALKGEPATVRTLFWEHMGNRAVREGRWKLVAVNQGPWQLYDMDADRSEVNNLVSEQPERVADLTAKYKAWAVRCGVRPGNPASKNKGE